MKLLLLFIFFIFLENAELTFSQEAKDYSLLNINNNQRSQVAKLTKVKQLLKELNMEYLKADENYIKVPVEIEGNTSMILIGEFALLEKEPSTKFIVIHTLVEKLPKNFKVNIPFLKEIIKINNILAIGNINIDDDEEFITYKSAHWLSTLSKETLESEIYLAHYNRLVIKKLLSNYLEE